MKNDNVDQKRKEKFVNGRETKQPMQGDKKVHYFGGINRGYSNIRVFFDRLSAMKKIHPILFG